MLEAGAEDLLVGLESHGSCEGWREVGGVLELRHGGPGGRGQSRAQPFLREQEKSVIREDFRGENHSQLDPDFTPSIIGNSLCFMGIFWEPEIINSYFEIFLVSNDES